MQIYGNWSICISMIFSGWSLKLMISQCTSLPKNGGCSLVIATSMCCQRNSWTWKSSHRSCRVLKDLPNDLILCGPYIHVLGSGFGFRKITWNVFLFPQMSLKPVIGLNGGDQAKVSETNSLKSDLGHSAAIRKQRQFAQNQGVKKIYEWLIDC